MPRFAVVAAAAVLLLLLLPVPKVMTRQVKTSNGSVLRGGSAFHSQSVRRRTNNGDSNLQLCVADNGQVYCSTRPPPPFQKFVLLKISAATAKQDTRGRLRNEGSVNLRKGAGSLV